MQRVKDERGAVGVVVAMLMVPLMGFAAISIDAAALWTQKLQLQAGADAGALAIAHDCARGLTLCATATDTAQQFADDNMNSDEATATVTAISSSQVTVRNSGVRDYWFAPVLGFDSSTIDTEATAAWGAPTGGTAVLPLAFSYCEFLAQLGGLTSITESTIYFTKSSKTTGCTPPSGNVVPGGFGWLTVNSGTCNTTSAIANILYSSTGVAVPSGCTTADFAALQGKTVLLPIFDQAGGSGSSAWYRVYGYAAFKITGYHFVGQYEWNKPCKGEDRCIRGYFTQFVGVSDAFDFGASAPPELGASIVQLTN
jgi:Flp pilus assembly protein TadG